jgi:hypothetical protein
MPRDDASVIGRFAEQLIVPEPDGTAQQLRCRNSERSMPEQIVEPGRNPPRSQSVKQDSVRIGGLVGMVLVPEFAPVVLRIEQK